MVVKVIGESGDFLRGNCVDESRLGFLVEVVRTGFGHGFCVHISRGIVEARITWSIW